MTVLDIDYHHGNGTQDIFYSRADVLTVSVRGDPLTEYPFYLGHADERGSGAGAGCNLNLPLSAGTAFADWAQALQTALDAVRRFGAAALVVALGWTPLRATRSHASRSAVTTTCGWAACWPAQGCRPC